ncbi:type I-C CRISPR-associated protein Cas8c/Csd1 [Thiomicrospira sp. R3]|uniref:type I-C CRISPR-associated protein Cas8c/Csd1 n=1 Tax=Thiomicrospira sp. R3 TaxID=3035472 RepID=UPI00259B3DC7|nr:type I-C CRISPR-associated protein Cas8c/Csd1 [Thiomicrospira sp. R3]WFE67792.1 type I-C CRISPR-associated protein Cas8c/Csd1 [Thiomicrospira sp. R3]
MILTALAQYYDRLSERSDKVPAYGFSEEKISYILVLSGEGDLVDIVPNLTANKKTQPKLMRVPMPAKKSVNISPNFLWGNTQYVIGLTAKTIKPPRTVNDYFESFKKLHLDKLHDCSESSLISFCNFLRKWDPCQIAGFSFPKGFEDKNVVFQIDGEKKYLHDLDESKAIWKNILTEMDEQSEHGICLVTGEKKPISRLHPSIKGVSGGQSSGVSIISFKKGSFESYGKEQGENAPVSEHAAFAYTTALNYLLRRENNQSIGLGDTSIVFWAQADKSADAQQAESLFMNFFNPPYVSDESETVLLQSEIEKLAKGRPLSEIAPDLDPKTQFFILGLAPNAVRLSIRFWLQTDFGHIQQRLAEHFQDLALDPLPWKTPPSIWRLLMQLAPHREGQKPKMEDVPAHLAGELMRSILTGQRYPRAILAQVLVRFRADGDISGLRVALIKAVLQREFRKQLTKEEIPMSLDESNTNAAYLLGRLFAVLENIQRIALGDKVNATIADKYYASASTVPYSVYPRLLSGSKHHLSKVRKDKPGLAFNLEKELGQIMSSLPTEFPRHFSIENQGRFSIGYYHQKNARFATTSKDENELTTEGEE